MNNLKCCGLDDCLYFYRYWEKKKVLLGRQTRQVIIELNIKPGSHVAIDDIRLEDCLPGNYRNYIALKSIINKH